MTSLVFRLCVKINDVLTPSPIVDEYDVAEFTQAVPFHLRQSPEDGDGTVTFPIASKVTTDALNTLLIHLDVAASQANTSSEAGAGATTSVKSSIVATTVATPGTYLFKD